MRDIHHRVVDPPWRSTDNTEKGRRLGLRARAPWPFRNWFAASSPRAIRRSSPRPSPYHPITSSPHHPITFLLSFSVSLCSATADLRLCGECLAASPNDQIRLGNTQYRAGDYAEALKTYEGAAKADPKSLEARFNQGVAAYKSGDAELAQRLFREVDSAAGNPDLAALARYNLGVIESQRLQNEPPEDPEKALESLKSAASLFRGALDLAPADPDAARNLELTRRAIKDLREQIEQMKRMQQQMKDLKDQLEKNQKEQQQASDQNQQRAADQKNDQEQKQEAQDQQQQVSDQTKQAQQKLDDLRKQTGADQQPDKPDDGTEGPPEAHRAGEPPDPKEKLNQASKSLKDAREKQDQAQQKIEQGDLPAAQEDQKQAAEDLKKALEQLGSPQNQDQNQENEENQPSDEDQPQPEQEQPQQQPQQEQQQPEAEQMDPNEDQPQTTDARLGRILDKERKDREYKQQQLRLQRARNRPVEKDW